MLSNLLESPVWRCSKMLLRKYNPCLLKKRFQNKKKPASRSSIGFPHSHFPYCVCSRSLFPLSTGLRSAPCPTQEASLQPPGPQPQQSPGNPPFFKAQFRLPSSILLSSYMKWCPIYTFTIIFIILYWLCFHICSHFGIHVLLLCVSSVPKIL